MRAFCYSSHVSIEGHTALNAIQVCSESKEATVSPPVSFLSPGFSSRTGPPGLISESANRSKSLAIAQFSVAAEFKIHSIHRRLSSICLI